MPLSNLLHAAAGTCPHCRQKAGIIAHAHRDCQETFQAGWTEMVAIAAEAARTHKFDEKNLRLTLAERSPAAPTGTAPPSTRPSRRAGNRGVAHSMADGILTQAEETLLREFRDRLAMDSAGIDRKTAEQLERASTDRLMLDARLAAIAV